MAWPPATYDVISRNHSHWPSLNLSQKEGLNEQLLKTLGANVLSSRKKLRKTLQEGGGGIHPQPCTSEGLIKFLKRYLLSSFVASNY